MKQTRNITIVATLLASSMAQAGTFSLIPWSNDADLSFIGSTADTHAAEFTAGGTVSTLGTSELTVNSVAFDALSTGSTGAFSNAGAGLNHVWTGSNYTITGPTGGFAFNGTAPDAAISGAAAISLTSGIAAGGDGALVFQLNGLAANTDYTFYYFSPRWNGPGRTGTLTSSLGDTSATFNQDAAGADQIVAYNYNTGANTSITITTNSDTAGQTLHNYGFYNAAAIPEPSSTALLGLGGLTLILRRGK